MNNSKQGVRVVEALLLISPEKDCLIFTRHSDGNLFVIKETGRTPDINSRDTPIVDNSEYKVFWAGPNIGFEVDEESYEGWKKTAIKGDQVTTFAILATEKIISERTQIKEALLLTNDAKGFLLFTRHSDQRMFVVDGTTQKPCQARSREIPFNADYGVSWNPRTEFQIFEEKKYQDWEVKAFKGSDVAQEVNDAISAFKERVPAQEPKVLSKEACELHAEMHCN